MVRNVDVPLRTISPLIASISVLFPARISCNIEEILSAVFSHTSSATSTKLREKRYPSVPATFDASITSHGRSAAVIALNKPDAWIVERTHDVLGFVLRAVVCYHDIELIVSLRKYALQAFLQQIRAIEGGYND